MSILSDVHQKLIRLAANNKGILEITLKHPTKEPSHETNTFGFNRKFYANELVIAGLMTLHYEGKPRINGSMTEQIISYKLAVS